MIEFFAGELTMINLFRCLLQECANNKIEAELDKLENTIYSKFLAFNESL